MGRIISSTFLIYWSPIDTTESCKKIKTDMLLLMCKKQTQKNKPAVNDNADPSDGLMTMLKKIYTDGDDEMKRTINKAWSESQEKKLKGEDMMDL
ncbi:hypothetical protein CRUP_026347 [Coryphaenoides rupestris]|nr:hypothetical protein CRUP_026347 [Coryphaenoides rupestris]